VVIKEKNLRVHLRQDGRSLFPKAWNFAGRVADFPMNTSLDAAFSLEEDTYGADRGFANWAAVLRDVRPST